MGGVDEKRGLSPALCISWCKFRSGSLQLRSFMDRMLPKKFSDGPDFGLSALRALRTVAVASPMKHQSKHLCQITGMSGALDLSPIRGAYAPESKQRNPENRSDYETHNETLWKGQQV